MPLRATLLHRRRALSPTACARHVLGSLLPSTAVACRSRPCDGSSCVVHGCLRVSILLRGLGAPRGNHGLVVHVCKAPCRTGTSQSVPSGRCFVAPATTG